MSTVDNINLADLLDEVTGALEAYSDEELRGVAIDLAAHVRRIQRERDMYATRAQVAEAKYADLASALRGIWRSLTPASIGGTPTPTSGGDRGGTSGPDSPLQA